MKMILLFVVVLIILDIGYEAIRFYHLVRVSSGLVAMAKPFERNEGTRSMLVVGDSTAVGVGADTPAHTLPGYLSAALDASVENHAVSGAVTADLAAQIAAAKEPHYDLVLIQVGANDVVRFHAVAETNAQLDTILTKANALSDKVVLITAGKIGEAPIFPWFLKALITHRALEMRSAFKTTAATHSTAYVDLYAIADPFNTDPDKYYAPDGFHLSSDGWHFWYEQTRNAITAAWPGFIHG